MNGHLIKDKAEAIETIRLLRDISGFGDVDKILSTFVSAFKNKTLPDLHDKKIAWLKGNFVMGGTKSGRLSSNGPNLQQMPSTKPPYAKPIKKCFAAPEGWLMVGADFSSLEDRIAGLITGDENKIKVYTELYDGHCLRAFSYFRDQMPDIENTVESINSIKSKYPAFRQDSKMPTFALTYMGTWRTLVENGGFSKEDAQRIEANYHELYADSDTWVQEQLKQAAKDGYIILAFGLKLRTPILEQVIIESESSLPYAAHKEMKTVGNALGQSYGLLNSRAANEFMERVWKSKYRFSILPIAQIHDAIYLCIKDEMKIIRWVNKNLVECMEWQELPPIQHPQVKLEAELEIFHPNWGAACLIPNKASKKEILARAEKHKEKLTK